MRTRGNDNALASVIYKAVLAAPALLVIPLTAGAADGYFLPRASAESKYSDNWRLQPEDDQQISALGAFFDLEAQLGLRSPRSDISVTPRLRSSFFTDSDDDDRLGSDDQFLNFAAYREDEKSRFAVTGGYANESVLTSELADVDFDDPGGDGGDTGRLDVRNDRERINVRPTWNYEYSEQTRFGLGYNFLDVKYDDQLLTRQVDFTDHRIDANLGRILTERTLLTTTVFGGRYEADQIDNTTDSVGLELDFDRRFTERVSGSLNVGAQRIDSEFINPVTNVRTEGSHTAFLFGLGLRTDVSEITSWNVNLGRSVQPNGTGFLVERDEFLVAVDHAFGPRLTGQLGARLFRNEAVDDDVMFTDRDYARVQGELRWAFTPTWSLFGAYQYTWQDFERQELLTGTGREGTASANAVTLGITYQGRLRP